MVVGILMVVFFAAVFIFFQTIAMLALHTTPQEEARKQLKKVKEAKGFQEFVYQKQIGLKKMGADVFLSDGITVGHWYLYKTVFAGLASIITFLVSKGVMHSTNAPIFTVLAAVIGWSFLDVYLKLMNKSSNEEMMADICEMSRSVLYGKRGGQYIADALRDAVMVVENKRLKMSLIRLKNNLDGGMSLDECLDEMELSFDNGEISAFCTVIKSLQSTGQVDESLKTLENNIEREQIGVNKRRCVILENKTMMYVMMIAFDILGVILYCIIMKLLEMQIAF
ncbi:type II secretion system F family protein [Eubacterium oxidoreducens]|uniref:Type II secretion system (T2SS), protein F n=1 Tax=Eubacterium oxidoreducens TaxID=1732 RepID=A0A1G6A154_EUBOX|nr:type II secretion system F family protein [Eubacterium oxidoreducens]SDB02159.1 Type II secretion system (T2SS), protein F [Eubacterium oxidoreducens]SEI83017.1 Type II secretion system (T2SS), protein F [Lachnospiraceae bacterium A10]